MFSARACNGHRANIGVSPGNNSNNRNNRNNRNNSNSINNRNTINNSNNSNNSSPPPKSPPPSGGRSSGRTGPYPSHPSALNKNTSNTIPFWGQKGTTQNRKNSFLTSDLGSHGLKCGMGGFSPSDPWDLHLCMHAFRHYITNTSWVRNQRQTCLHTSTHACKHNRAYRQQHIATRRHVKTSTRPYTRTCLQPCSQTCARTRSDLHTDVLADALHYIYIYIYKDI